MDLHHFRLRSKTYLKVQPIRVDDIVVDNLDFNTTLLGRRQVLDQLPELRSANAVGTVDSKRSLDLDVLHHPLECLRKLDVVSLFCRLAILVRSPQRVQGAHNVVQLGCRQVLEVLELHFGCRERGIEDSHQARSRGSCIPCKDDARGILHVDVNLLDQLLIDLGDRLLRRICQPGCVRFPLSLDSVQ